MDNAISEKLRPSTIDMESVDLSSISLDVYQMTSLHIIEDHINQGNVVFLIEDIPMC